MYLLIFKIKCANKFPFNQKPQWYMVFLELLPFIHPVNKIKYCYYRTGKLIAPCSERPAI
jgi:hypothetical protein